MKMQLVAAVAVLTILSLAPASSAGVAANGGGSGSREVTLRTSKDRVTHGSGFVLTGRVTTDDAASRHCVSGVEVAIVRDGWNDVLYDWADVVQVKTSGSGRFRAALMAEHSANYRAEVQEMPSGCGRARSKRVAVRSRLQVTLEPLKTSVGRGEVVRLVAKAEPRCLEDEEMVLQQLVDGRFVGVASKAPNARCVAVFWRRVHDDSVFRAAHPEAASVAFVYLGNRSALTAVSVRDETPR